jgi:hypothetical protein
MIYEIRRRGKISIFKLIYSLFFMDDNANKLSISSCQSVGLDGSQRIKWITKDYVDLERLGEGCSVPARCNQVNQGPISMQGFFLDYRI